MTSFANASKYCKYFVNFQLFLLTVFILAACPFGTILTAAAREPLLSKDSSNNSEIPLNNGVNRSLENPLIPMGAITGQPTRERIREILTGYRSVGITQFLIYPRAGCEIEYMSDQWLQTCEWVCEEAHKLGFTSIWLYDEFNWPSGTCNKQVMKVNPKFEMPQLCVNKNNSEYKIVIRKNPQMSYLMDPEAVDCFIKMTHEKYYARLGKYFGTLIKGIFSDEPDIGYFDRSNNKDIFRMGWYFDMPKDYAKATGGRDLYQDILDGVKNNSNDFAAVCNRLLGERFRAVYVDRISQWCKDHRIVFTGHMMNESTTDLALSSNGHALLALSGLSLPGIDEIFTHNRIDSDPDSKMGATKGAVEWLTFSTGMYAIEKQGNRGGLAELFALGPCEMSFTRQIKQIWLAAAFGIDHYVLAVAPVDARGNSIKNRYYTAFTMDQPLFPSYKYLSENARQAAMAARKDRDCEIAVRYPYTYVKLPEFLMELVRHQCGWRLLLPGENADPSAKMIFDFTPQGIKEEKSGTIIDNFDSFYKAHLQKQENEKVLVVDKNGNPVSDVFVRRFTDGSAIVLDFSGKNRDLFWQRFGLKTPFTLMADGVVTLPGWNVSIDRPNVMRLEFDSKTKISRFEIAEPIKDLRLAIRQFGGQANFEFNGKKLEAMEPCVTLPPGFKDLYKERKLSLAPGKYEIKQIGSEIDHPFLPLGFLIGHFARNAQSDALVRYRNDGKGLKGYAGSLKQTTNLTIPADALRVSLLIESGDAELLIDGNSLGTRISAPYRWIVPDPVRGKTVNVTIIRHSSIAPLFGKIRTKLIWRERDNSESIPGIVDLIWE